VAILAWQPTERSRQDPARSRRRGGLEYARAWRDVQFVVARAPNLDDRLFGVVGGPRPPAMVIVEGQTDVVLASADVAVTASGTATCRRHCNDTPMVIVYRLSPATYFLGRRLVTLDTFGMVNLIAGDKIVPELIQAAFTPEAVANETVLDADRPRARDAHSRRPRARAPAPWRPGREPAAPPKRSCASSRGGTKRRRVMG